MVSLVMVFTIIVSVSRTTTVSFAFILEIGSMLGCLTHTLAPLSFVRSSNALANAFKLLLCWLTIVSLTKTKLLDKH